MVYKTAGKNRSAEEQVTGLLDSSNLRRCQTRSMVSLGRLPCGASTWSSLVVTPIYFKDQSKEILEFQNWEELEKLSHSSSLSEETEAQRPQSDLP